MKKVLFLVPHLSTGGMPQYTYDLMRKIKNDVDVYCIEYSMVSPDFIVQRNRIINLLGDKFYCLGDDKNELFSIIEKIQPDIIHLQEMPEYFLDNSTASKLYSNDRNYLILETSHDSSFSAGAKRFYPDHLGLISEFQKKEFSKLGIPISLIEADIEYRERQDRTEGLKKLGLNPNLKHILNVGLFTPRKNQAEAIEYARKLEGYPIQFHFVGNQADNFRDYWKPLLENLPSNVKIWGERSDVDNFYSCMDLMLFTSRGTGNDKETSPLVIREAIGFNLPSLIYNLPVYLDMYKKYKNITYLNEDSNENARLILEKLDLDNHETTFFKIEYDNTDNKILFTPDKNAEDITISIRDIDSTAVIWSAHYDNIPANTTYWIIPTPKFLIDFETDPNFGGMTIEIYRGESLIQTKDIRIKSLKSEKHKIQLKNHTEPVFMNYTEFFVQKIYDRYLAGNRYDTVLDVGANVGIWSEYIRTVSETNNIYAFEPNKNALKILNDSYGDKITIINKAMTNKDGEIEFFVSNDNSLISSAHNYDNLSVSYKVDSISFKTFVSQYGLDRINLFKVDIETGEYDLFESLDKQDLDMIDNILVEFHTFAGRTFDKDTNRLIEIINDAGFTYEVHHLHDVGGFIFATRTPNQTSPINKHFIEILDNNLCTEKRGLASLVNKMYPKGIGVEIGVLRGEFSKIILERWEQGTLYMVDTWRHIGEYVDLNGRDDQYHYDCMTQTARNIKDYQDRAHMIRMDSVQSSHIFPDEYFDFIFIDADHSYQAVVRDLESWWPKIKKGGLFCGDDYIPDDGDIWLINHDDGTQQYAGKFGVRKAVNEFAQQNGLKIYSTTDEPYWKQWYTFKPF
jgi:FkbM family methyltransferase